MLHQCKLYTIQKKSSVFLHSWLSQVILWAYFTWSSIRKIHNSSTFTHIQTIFSNIQTKFSNIQTIKAKVNIQNSIFRFQPRKYHVQIMLLFVYTTTHKRFVIFTCRYFKLSRNPTAWLHERLLYWNPAYLVVFTGWADHDRCMYSRLTLLNFST